MAAQRKQTRRHPNIQPPTGFDFDIPKGHERVVVKVRQPNGSVDRDEALKILKQRPYVSKVVDKLKYCGVTSVYHVFSYPVG
jgi:hypothetical protein